MLYAFSLNRELINDKEISQGCRRAGEIWVSMDRLFLGTLVGDPCKMHDVGLTKK